MTVSRTKLHVVADHHHGGPLPDKLLQDGGKRRLELCVQALCRFIEQEHLRTEQQKLGECRLLHFAAGQVKRMARGQPVDLAKAHDGFDPFFPLLLRYAAVLQGLGERFPHGLAGKERLRFLRQGQYGSVIGNNFSAVRLSAAAQQRKQRALSGAVAAHDRQKLAAFDLDAEIAQDVGRVLFIAEPDMLQRDDRFACRRNGFFLQRMEVMRLCKAVQPCPALGDRNRTRRIVRNGIPNAHRRRQRQKAPAAHTAEVAAGARGNVIGDQSAVLQHQHAVAHGQQTVQTVLGDDHGHTQLPVDALQTSEKLRSCYRVKLRRRFVEQQQLRLHCHDRRQIDKLLLTARERLHLRLKQILYAEERSGFRDAAADLVPF